MQKEIRKAGRPSQSVPREVLIKAAISVFSRHGYSAASLDRIAERSGIRKPSLLYRFGNKEALYIESISMVLGSLGDMVGAAVLSEGSYVDSLDRLGAAITDYMGQEPDAARLLFREVMDRGPYISGPQGDLFAVILGMAVQFVEAGDAAGEFSISDPKDLILTIVGVHLSYFAIDGLSEIVKGAPIYDAESIERRKREVLLQVRRLCGVS